MIDWNVEGLQFGSCSCAYGCPCQFEADMETHIARVVILSHLRHLNNGVYRD